MTYNEATRHATWDEAFVFACGESVRQRKWQTSYVVRLWRAAMDQALSRELTRADRDPYEFRMMRYPLGMGTL